MTRAGLKGRCFLKLKSVLLKVSYIEKWPKFAYLESKVPHLKFRVMRDRVYAKSSEAQNEKSSLAVFSAHNASALQIFSGKLMVFSLWSALLVSGSDDWPLSASFTVFMKKCLIDGCLLPSCPSIVSLWSSSCSVTSDGFGSLVLENVQVWNPGFPSLASPQARWVSGKCKEDKPYWTHWGQLLAEALSPFLESRSMQSLIAPYTLGPA